MKRLLFVFMVVVLLLVACSGGGGQEAQPAQGGGEVKGDPARGEALFKEATIGGAPGCSTCHSLEPGKNLVGPSLAGIGAKGEDYIRESIVDPNATIAEGFTPNVMYQNYGKDLSEQQIADLVAFLATLK